MYIKVTKKEVNGKITEHAKIVEGYRENNKVKHRTLLNLGPIRSKEDKIKYQQILNSIKGGQDEFIKKRELIVKCTKEYGITYTVNKLLKKYEIDKILRKELAKNKAQFDIFGIIKALIINRLIKPSSDLSAYDWMCNDYSEEFDVKKHQIYRALDHLIKRKAEIEKGIFENLKEKLKLNTKVIHYDLTSSYFEGSKCAIAFYGHSRDHRSDRKQIVIGLVMHDGIPIYHEIYGGNTVDKATLKSMANNLKEKLGIKKATIVADRGLITESNLEMLEDEEYNFILGLPRRNNNIPKEHLIKKINSEEKQVAKEVGKKTIKRDGKKYVRRYILCLNKDTRKERLETLDKIRKDIGRKLSELQKKYCKSQEKKKGKKITKENLILYTYKILGKNKRLFHIKEDKGLKFSLNKENFSYEKQIAGKFLLTTNTQKKPEEIMKAYKELQMVENAFDEIKNFLDIRPIEHHKERRVKAHVFVCVLSFLIESIIEKFSKESARKTLEKLKRIDVVQIKVGKTNEKRLTMGSLIDAKDIFKRLRIKQPSYICL